ncbi:TPA: hypothetical protein ACX4HG_003521 [Escherichia coli]
MNLIIILVWHSYET